MLVAVHDGDLLGSVNLLRSEMKSWPQLTPWLAQLFVAPGARREGTGAALVTAAIAYARRCGFCTLYLIRPERCPNTTRASDGTNVEYLGKERAVMQYAIEG